ncbi:MAG: cyclic lactone autoinducer peptide [Halanaerobiaceae bacterium]
MSRLFSRLVLGLIEKAAGAGKSSACSLYWYQPELPEEE